MLKPRFLAGVNYELTYSVPQDEEAAEEMATKFKAKLLDKKTGRQVASRSTAELGKFKGAPPIALRSGDELKPKVNSVAITTPNKNVTVPADINVDAAVSKDTVKRMKFWWLMANEEERKRIKEWIKSVGDIK